MKNIQKVSRTTAGVALSMMGTLAFAGSLTFSQLGVSNFADKGSLNGFSFTLSASTVACSGCNASDDLIAIESLTVYGGGGNGSGFVPVTAVLYDGDVEVARSSNQITANGSTVKGTAYTFSFPNSQLSKSKTYRAYFLDATDGKSVVRLEVNSSPKSTSTTQLINKVGGGVYTAYSPKFSVAANPSNPSVGTPSPSPDEPSYYYVVVLAGQSNMVGYGEVLAEARGVDAPNPRVKQLGRGGELDKKMKPADHSLDHVQLMRGSSYNQSSNHAKVKDGTYNWRSFGGAVGSGQWIGKNLLPHIPSDAGILLVPAARGSSGFTGGTDSAYTTGTIPLIYGGGSTGGFLKWGASGGLSGNTDGKTALYLDMVARTKAALDLNSKNILAGVIWVQGEADLSRASSHKTKFEEQVNTFASDLNGAYSSRCWKANCTNTPWVTGDTTAHWKGRNSTGYDTIYQNTYKKSTLANVSFVEYMYDANGVATHTNAYNLDSNSNPTGADSRTGTADGHFGSDAYRGVIATKLANGLKAAIDKATAP